MKRAILSVILSVLAVCLLSAEPPKTVSQIPAYPGATLVSEQQAPTKEELASGKPVFIFRLERVSSSTASVDEIAKFYAGKLGAVIEQEGGADPSELAPGQVSTVGSAVEYWDLDSIDQSTDEVKAAFAARPHLPQAESWARVAEFSWAFKNTEKDPYSFTLTISDNSVSEDDPPIYHQASEIALSVKMINLEKMQAALAPTKEDLAAQQAYAKQQQQANADAAANAAKMDASMAAANAEAKRFQDEMAKAPSEKDLGVAIYPGARYEADLSAQQSMFLTDKSRVYVFSVEARPDVVVRFYEKKTGNKNMSIAPTLAFIPISFGKPAQKGDNPPVKDNVAIGSKTADGPCVLMFTKRGPGWTGQEGGGK
jgi:hypothetical protein